MADVHQIYPTPNDARVELDEAQDQLNALARSLAREALRHGNGGGMSSDMDQRVTRLETHMEYVRADLSDIKADQKTIIAALSTLPTKRDLTANILVMVAIGLSVLALTVGGIIGGLAWLDRPAPVAAASK